MRSSTATRRAGRLLGCLGAVALIMGAVAAVAWASPASGSKGGSAITAAANDNANPSADDHGKGNGPPPNGSVGNADDKNPPGQSNGDHNRGYECDDNPGVGNGNPAHTGCTPDDNVNPSGGGSSGGTTTTTVTPTTVQPPAAEVLGETETRPEARPVTPAELAFTGASATWVLTLTGVALMLVGMLLLAAARRPTEVTS